uniref:Torsin-1A-interacting protein 1/2 AAA+ activator domain-containing protein n=1 Tax=Leptobrachium leishanense TaxID=445787 RepID=A0A8C5R829_9ANUR
MKYYQGLSERGENQENEQSRPNKTTQMLCLLLGTLLIASFIAVIGVIFVSELKQKHGESVNLNAFQAQVGELQSAFPSQNEILWKRSQRILERHLNNSQPKEPAILLLTAATDAEETLLCLSRRLARAYAISRKGSYTVISGTQRTFDDGKEAKMFIDETLSRGFEASAKAAVLHRLESLPPGSILILYKYCDHENAAYKNVALLITVLLPDETLDPNMDLKELEEKVRDFLKDKFIGSNPDENISHSDMDMDKLSGVWSRIAHVVLPVRPESNNQEGCKDVE